MHVSPPAAAGSPARSDGAWPGPRQSGHAACAVVLTLAVLAASPVRSRAQEPGVVDGPGRVVQRLETALSRHDVESLRGLLSPALPSEQIDAAVAMLKEGVTRAVVRERDRVPLPGVPGDGYRLVVEIFIEQDRVGSLMTYRLDLRRLRRVESPSLEEPGWRIYGLEQLTSVAGLYRLQLDTAKQFRVEHLTVSAEDLEVQVPSGTAFVSETDDGITAIVVLGEGTLRFAPRPEAERGQVRLFCGEEALVTPIRSVFLRFSPTDFDAHISPGSLVPEPVDPRRTARAQAIFDEEVAKSFGLDLHDMSSVSWSLIPGVGDFLAELHTRKYRTLTYARSTNEAEDISLFDRVQRRNISVYQSKHKRDTLGADYNEDDLADYDILDYDIDASYDPGHEWLDAHTRVKLRVRSTVLGTMTMKLHEALTLRSVSSDELGRLLFLRVRDQNSFLINLPTVLQRDDVLTLRISYAGRIPPLTPDREVLTVGDDQVVTEGPVITPERRFVLSNRSYWYPQGPFTDYATARLRLTVPVPYGSIASGSPAAGNPHIVKAEQGGQPDRSVSEFLAGQPARYFSWVISRFVLAARATVPLPPPAAPSTGDRTGSDAARRTETDGTSPGTGTYAQALGVRYSALDLDVMANPRQVGRGRAVVGDVGDILGFYAGLLSDLPYPTFTLALVDDEVPGGHSPPYFALLYQPLPTSGLVWRNDPVYFDGFPSFFLAHELAHQYWGQAVGWKSHHNQWISEGFAQYFAALYAEKHGSPGALRDILGRMRRTVFENEDQGPISLGYRLGHIRGESRVFRSIIYNKGALVLHMLRRLVGDAVFFEGLKDLYWSNRFAKVGTSDVQRVFERVSGRPLARFFERWVDASALPRVGWSWRVAADGETGGDDPGGTASQPAAGAGSLLLHFEQSPSPTGVFDIPVTVTVTYADGTSADAVVTIDDSVVDARLPLRRQVRRVELNEDNAALARFDRR